MVLCLVGSKEVTMEILWVDRKAMHLAGWTVVLKAAKLADKMALLMD